MKSNVELPDACDVVSDILEVLVLEAGVKGVVILVVFLPSFVNDTFDWGFGVGEISNCFEVNLDVLFFLA